MTIKRLSVLDQSPIPSGSTAQQALADSVRLAQITEALGYHRYWVAEHHGSRSFAGSAPEILIGHIASATKRIRVGSGGVMLMHYSPLKVAETFKLLQSLHPGRIDLGIGRAPGSDGITAAALAYGSQIGIEYFPAKIGDLKAFLADEPAFTEAFAFVFQENDLMLLGLEPDPDPLSEALAVVGELWATVEIGAVSLVDMKIWRWMYDNPEATPAELREAMLGIAREVWNSYFADIFGARDVTLLGVYSHIIHSFLYVPDYALGHMIALQVKEQMRKAGNIGDEFERMAVAGCIAPDLWMQNATGSDVGVEAMLEAVERALEKLE